MALRTFICLISVVQILSIPFDSCGDHPCTCNDVNGGVCTEPAAASEIHVGTIDECIENCDLFGSFGSCDWIMFYPPEQNPGRNENCRLIVNGVEKMEDYLGTCRYLGQPIFHKPELPAGGVISGECMPNALAGTGACAPTCDGVCHDCASDGCSGYAEAECTFDDDTTGESQPLPTYEACHTICSNLATQGGNNLAYIKFDKESTTCNCEHTGVVSCKIKLVKSGLSPADIASCAA